MNMFIILFSNRMIVSAIINVNICRMMFIILYDKEECMWPGGDADHVRRTIERAGLAEGLPAEHRSMFINSKN